MNAKDAKGIEALQRRLVATGHYPELAKALKKDGAGHFGPLTKKALQTHLANNPLNDASTAVLLEGTKQALRDLEKCGGDRRSACIFTIQAANDLVIDRQNPIGMDGIYGPKTKKLVENGEFTGRALHKLMQISGASATVAPTTTIAPVDASAANDSAGKTEPVAVKAARAAGATITTDAAPTDAAPKPATAQPGTQPAPAATAPAPARDKTAAAAAAATSPPHASIRSMREDGPTTTAAPPPAQLALPPIQLMGGSPPTR